MGRNCFFALLITSRVVDLFGAAGSSSGRDEMKLRLLAGGQNAGFVSEMVRSLISWESAKYVPESLLIVGPSRSGKSTLAREIAERSGRECDQYVLRANEMIPDLLTKQSCKKAPHVTVVDKLHLLGQNTARLDDWLSVCKLNKKLCVIGICDEKFEQPDLCDLFSYRIALCRPDSLSRKEILAYYLSAESFNNELIDFIAEETAGVTSGKLKVLSDRLSVLIDQAQGHNPDRKSILKELGYVIPRGQVVTEVRLSKRACALSMFMFAVLGVHVWDWAARTQLLGDTDNRMILREKIISTAAYVINLINLNLN
jgi:hypothetical protein